MFRPNRTLHVAYGVTGIIEYLKMCPKQCADFAIPSGSFQFQKQASDDSANSVHFAGAESVVYMYTTQALDNPITYKGSEFIYDLIYQLWFA